MAWNLPKAWSPGFALPGYVRAEGLQRRAFVTEYPPDGTYDNPDVGNNGNFAVPKYIMKEGYGGGAFVTKWAPRGTYYGPKIPQFIEMPESEVTSSKKLPGGGYEYNVDSLAGDSSIDEPMPEPFESFGTQAADVIIKAVARAPRNQRKAHMRTILNKIDPTLYGRATGIARTLVGHGMHPTQAVGRGIAKAMSTGMAAEIVNLGHKHIQSGGKVAKPANKGLLGLGCYGPSPMGSLATTVAAAGALNKTVPCLGNPPPGYTYDSSIRKFRPKSPSELAVSKRGAGTADDPTGARGICVTFDQLATSYHGQPVYNVGPFQIPIDASSYRYVWQSPQAVASLPADWRAAILQAFDPNAPGKDSANPQTIQPGPVTPGVLDYLNAMGIPQPIDFNVIATAQGFQSHWWDAIPILGGIPLLGVVDAAYQGISGSVDDMKGPPQPIAQFQHPKTGDQWGAWLKIRATKNGTPDPVTNPIIMEITFGKMPDNPWYSQLLGWIFWPVVELAVVAKTVVKGALELVGALACAAVQTPGAAAGGAVAGGAYGGAPGAQAGAVGAQIAAAACGTPPPMYGSDSWTLPLVIAGGVGLVAYLLTRGPRKKHAGGTGGGR
jgi:hypothetical protein